VSNIAKLTSIAQSSLVTLLCYDEAAAKKVRALVETKSFDVHWREIAQAACDHHEKYGRVPADHTADIIESLCAAAPKKAGIYAPLFDDIKANRETIDPAFVLDQAADFAKYQRLNAGITTALDGLQRESPEGVLEAAEALTRSLKEYESAGAAELKSMTLADIATTDFPTPEAFVDDDLIVRKRLTLIVAPPKVGKSLTALFAAKAVASGRADQWLGSMFSGRRAPTIYVTAEGGPEMVQQRSRLLPPMSKTGQPADCHVIAARPFPRLDSAKGLALLGRHVEKVGAGLVVLDPLAALRDVEDENDNAAAQAFADGLREFAEKHNVALLLVHHPSKVSQAEGTSGSFGGGRGASALFAAVDNEISLRKDAKTGDVHATFSKRFGAPIEPGRCLRLNPKTLVLDYVGPLGRGKTVDPSRAKYSPADFEAVLSDGGWWPRSKIVEEIGCTDSTFRDRVRGWSDALGGRVEKRVGGPPHGENEYRLRPAAPAPAAKNTKRVFIDDEEDD